MCAHTPPKLQELEELRENYEKGRIDRETVSDLMEMSIDAELTKADEEIDSTWLNACIDLMAYVDRTELEQTAEQHETTWKVVQASIRKERWKKHSRTIGRIACAAACVVLVLTGASISFRWFRPSQSIDEQVYTLTGEEVKINTESSASAGESSESGKCTTSDLQELCEFLGYTPQLPTWVPEGWELNGYYASANSESQWITVVYEKTGEKNCLIYDYKQAEDISTISVDFYQDGAGEYVKLKNGMDIYLTTNTDEPVAVWTTSNTYSCATGPVSVEELKTFILGIQ